MKLAECKDSFLMALLGSVRRSTFEHPDEGEPGRAEDRTAERDRTVTRVAVATPKATLQPRSEEDEHQCDQGCEEQTGDLMLTSVVLPPRERFVERRLTARNAVRQGESTGQ